MLKLMSQFGQYYVRFSGMRNELTGLPPWARTVFLIVATPGILLVGLSIVALVVSLLALLLLTVPVYALLRSVTGRSEKAEGAVVYDPDPNRIHGKRVEAKVIEPGQQVPDEVNGE
jgi:hypothetical protein